MQHSKPDHINAQVYQPLLPDIEKDNRYVQVAKEVGFGLNSEVAAQAWQRN